MSKQAHAQKKADSQNVAPPQIASPCGNQAHRRVHVGARNRAEHGDQYEQHRAGRHAIAEQRDRIVSGRQLLGHDSGADDGRKQEEGANSFRREPLRQRWLSRRRRHPANSLPSGRCG